MKKTGKQQVLEHLQQNGSINPMEALMRYGIMRLGARIYELRDDGHNIKTRIATTINKKRYARYILTKTEEK